MSIAYSTDDIAKAHKTRFFGKTLIVRRLIDNTVPIESDPYLENRLLIERDGRKWYFNHRDNYRNKQISPWISQMLANHLKVTGLFGAVQYEPGQEGVGDYELRGTIKKFVGYKETNKAKAVSPIAALFVTSRNEGTTILVVRLVEMRTGFTVWEGSVEGRVEGRGKNVSYDSTAYENANISLKDAINKLIQILEAHG